MMKREQKNSGTKQNCWRRGQPKTDLIWNRVGPKWKR